MYTSDNLNIAKFVRVGRTEINFCIFAVYH